MDRTAPRRPTSLAGLFIVASLAACSSGRTAPPLPAPSHGTAATASRAGAAALPVSDAYELAVALGTRTHTGAPGLRYWQQWADYRLEAELYPISKRLMG